MFPFYEASRNKIVTLAFVMTHQRGVLSQILRVISDAAGNVLTIHQGIPLQGIANATISVETANLTVGLEPLLEELRAVEGVNRLEVLGQE